MPNSDQSMLNWVDSIANTASLYGGSTIMKFSQSLPPTSTLIATYGATRNGVCEALSNRWIVDHANGSSLWNWLCNANGQVQPSKVANVMINFIDTLSMPGPGGVDKQSWNTERYLLSHGIRRRLNITSGNRLMSQDLSRRGRGSVSAGQDLANALVALRNTDGCYRHIAIYGPRGGHAMCAWVGADVAFFDPNFGEYWFEKKSNFVRWFNRFWQSTGYSQSYGGFELRDYAVGMGFVKGQTPASRGKV